jgi:hypothetical protein
MARNPVIFSNGTLRQKAQVEIDGTVYEVEPAQYEGTTPLSAYNLNRLQENLYDYVDEKTTQEIQTFTERVVDNRNPNRYVDICWKKVDKVIQINIAATIPANAGSTMTMTNFNFTIPQWAKVSSNYTNILYGENIYLISAIRSFIADSNGVQRGVVFNLLYNNNTNTQYIYGSLMNTTSNNAVIQGSISYILD